MIHWFATRRFNYIDMFTIASATSLIGESYFILGTLVLIMGVITSLVAERDSCLPY